MDFLEYKLAVIILNFNTAGLTKACIKQLLSLSTEIEIVVVDNASSDDSAEILSKFCEEKRTCHFIKNDVNSGYAMGNNVGIRYVCENLKSVDTICIMNPDIVVEKIETFKKLYISLWSDKKIALITSQTIYNHCMRYPNDFGWKHLTPSYMIFGGTLLGKLIKTNIRYKNLHINDDKVAYCDIVQGCFFLSKLNVLQQVDFFDEGTFLYSEEAILGKKVQRAGYCSGVLIDEFIYHNHKEKDKSLISKKKKLFDMKCFYSSRKYYIENYSDKSSIFIFFAKCFLNIDFFLKRIWMGFSK